MKYKITLTINTNIEAKSRKDALKKAKEWKKEMVQQANYFKDYFNLKTLMNADVKVEFAPDGD